MSACWICIEQHEVVGISCSIERSPPSTMILLSCCEATFLRPFLEMHPELNFLTLVLEFHSEVIEVPKDGAQIREPLDSQDKITPTQGCSPCIFQVKPFTIDVHWSWPLSATFTHIGEISTTLQSIFSALEMSKKLWVLLLSKSRWRVFFPWCSETLIVWNVATPSRACRDICAHWLSGTSFSVMPSLPSTSSSSSTSTSKW